MDEIGGLRRDADVTHYRCDLGSGRLELRMCDFELVSIACGNCQTGTLLGQLTRDQKAEASRSPGNDD
jgi:hypothetical protein